MIKKLSDEKGYQPSLRELADAMGIRSTNGVADHVRALVRKGYIERTERQARSIRIVGQTPGCDGEVLRRIRTELEQLRAEAKVWEQRAREAGWSDPKLGAG